MEKAFAQWPRSLWSEDSTGWNFPEFISSDSFDIVIVGAGYSGLWTAHHLLDTNPSLSIAILDAQQPGFGASGRNGGWCSAFAPMSLEAVAAQSSTASAIDLQNALSSSIDEIGNFVFASHIDCDWRKGGTLSFASNQPQLQRIHESIAMARKFGFDEQFVEFLTQDQANARVRTHSLLGASYSPHCAVVHPVKLVDGLVNTIVERGVQFFGNTHVVEIESHRVRAQTPKGSVSITGKWVVRATEGFTARMKQYRRDVAPLYSYMIATEPLSKSQWDDLGWNNRETVSDGRNLVIYAQRTADGRIAFGGRGAPYKFASRVGAQFDYNTRIHSLIESSMRTMFPAIGNSAVTHKWGGALGVHRDWFTTAQIDHQTNIASLGGYVGDGVAFSYVAAREVARSIQDSFENKPLPIVNHTSRRWEPEPFRFIGINTMLRLTEKADETEQKKSRTNRFINWLLGKLIP
jgi:glycine/D-amino acid oxidase-like deaminating enzyme